MSYENKIIQKDLWITFVVIANTDKPKRDRQAIERTQKQNHLVEVKIMAHSFHAVQVSTAYAVSSEKE